MGSVYGNVQEYLFNPCPVSRCQGRSMGQARFYLDDTLVQIERRAPYYFKGVSITRKPRMASFVDGLHTIRVDYDHRDGQTYSESASFQVGEQPAPRTGNTFPASLNLTIGDQSITMNLTLSVDADGNVTSLG